MAKKVPPGRRARLEHISKAISDIFRFTDDMDVNRFMQDERTQLAVIKLFEIIGEATYHIDKSFKRQHTHIEWKKMEGLRHILVHEYYRIEPDILWYTKEVFLSDLQFKVDALIKKS